MIEVVMLRLPDDNFLHVAVNTSTDKTVMDCELIHDEPISFLDCPVASRWTLVRAK